MQLIPAIDLLNGRCVRLLQGDFAAETRYDQDPHALLEQYRLLGAQWVHIVDLDGARDGVRSNRGLIGRLARDAITLQVGGGLRDAEAVRQALDAGIGRVVIGSAAVTQVDAVRSWLQEFGSERIVLAFDVRFDATDTPCVALHGWRDQSQLSLWSAVAEYAELGLAHVLCTDVSRDGALSGPNVDLYAEAVARFPAIAWQASGGVRNALDLHSLAGAGAAAAVSGKALLENLIPVEELRPFLPNA